MKTLIDNKKAYFNFEVLDKYEAGLILEGWEVKSIKAGRANIGGSYIKFRNKEAYLVNAHVSNWKSGMPRSVEEENKERKLLLQKSQINKIELELKQKGITAVPLDIFENDRKLVKLTLGLVRGKKKFDKRLKLKERDIKRSIDQDRKRYNF